MVVCLTLSGVGAASARTGSRAPAQPAFSASDGSTLASESCQSARACTAVGYYFSKGARGLAPLAERWNGHRWTFQRPPDPAHALETFLTAVSCHPATSCEAVGYYFSASGIEPLAERWNGRRWAIQRIPHPSSGDNLLRAVSCKSASACIAVGYYEKNSHVAMVLSERWNGRDWRYQLAAGPSKLSLLYGMFCVTARSCTAVGQYDNGSGMGLTLAEHWNGRKWTTQHTPDPAGATQSDLLAVSCQSATACTAVGSYNSSSPVVGTLAEHWNGHRWTLLHAVMPTGAAESSLQAIGCHSATACIAVGYYTDTGGFNKTLAEYWDGHHWTIQSTPNVAGGKADIMLAVRCPVAASCIAVGYYTDTGGFNKTLAEHWNGHHWTIQPTPNPAS